MPASPPTKRKPSAADKSSAPKRPTKAVRRGASGVQIGEDTARSLVLQGASGVFAQKGARLSSVEDILAASGVSRRTFYRFFESKDDVLVALYRIGTDALLAACKLAVEQTPEPKLRFERCVDAHLRNARGLGRLIFVLGGEAQRYESPLHAQRMQVHEELVMLFTSKPRPASTDPLAVRALVLALEGIVRFTLQEGDEGRAISDESLTQAKRVMMKLGACVFS